MYRLFRVRLPALWTSANRSTGCVLSVPFRRCHFEECVTERLGRRAKPLTTPLTTVVPYESTVQARWPIMFSQGKSKHKTQQKTMFREYSNMSQLLTHHCPQGYLVQYWYKIYRPIYFRGVTIPLCYDSISRYWTQDTILLRYSKIW